MPLRDHFRSPVNDTHSWDEVHGQWPGEIVRQLTTVLPPGFRAAPRVHLGSSFEIDDSGGGTATLAAAAPTFTLEADLTDQDEYEVRIYDTERGRTLVAAIEIVSPSNKVRPESRDIFVGKVGSLLSQGVCVSLVDLVSVRQANLYAELLELAGGTDPQLGPTPPPCNYPQLSVVPQSLSAQAPLTPGPCTALKFDPMGASTWRIGSNTSWPAEPSPMRG